MAIVKKFGLFIVFFTIFGSNLYLISYGYTHFNLYAREQKILTEIDGIKKTSYTSSSSYNNNSVLGIVADSISVGDGRADNLRSFFRKHHSPLYDFADLIVKTSDTYHFDYRLLPAIAMQESTLCKYIPENSHNCWGYGIYGSIVTRFSSYYEAIEVVANNLKSNYLDKGYTTPELIMSKYTPRSPGSWARSINLFITSME
ncbi:MAG TPA: hypothetical protein VJB63_00890 [Patescibacteria group bacterium]|nr:hypothetical protein [Patescibacteria group bacterium]